MTAPDPKAISESLARWREFNRRREVEDPRLTAEEVLHPDDMANLCFAYDAVATRLQAINEIWSYRDRSDRV